MSNILGFMQDCANRWKPSELSYEDMKLRCSQYLPSKIETDVDYFLITQTTPYIDALYVHPASSKSIETMYIKRFVFHDNYRWDYEDERLFEDLILKNNRLIYSCEADRIFDYYSEKFPDWKLKRYYTDSMRLLDHIYHCMRKGSAKEMLYKAGLDELAANIGCLDELDLLSSKPTDIYGGISMRTLRSLNSKTGSLILANSEKRNLIKSLQMKFPEMFNEVLNDAQGSYLNFLLEGDLTVDEIGRLYSARRSPLGMMWATSQYRLFIMREKMSKDVSEKAEMIAKMDPIYRNYIDKQFTRNDDLIRTLYLYLILQRQELDIRFKQSNRKRNQAWQERNNGYVVRFPQTINDFCREAVYMSNCLLTYVAAYLENDTNILFVRQTNDFNAPFITMEIYNGELMQAYHRFNVRCTCEEAQWICEYCDRHGIKRGFSMIVGDY